MELFVKFPVVLFTSNENLSAVNFLKKILFSFQTDYMSVHTEDSSTETDARKAVLSLFFFFKICKHIRVTEKVRIYKLDRHFKDWAQNSYIYKKRIILHCS